MLRTILGFAAGAIITSLIIEKGSVKKFKDVAKEKAVMLKSATCKAAAAARDEFRGDAGKEVQADN
jgi:hypothetical protein